MSTGLSVYLDGSSREEQPVGRVWRVQVVLQEGGSVGSIDQQHVVKPPTGLISFGALGSLLSPAETHAISLGVMWQGKQVDDSAAVSRGSRGEEEKIQHGGVGESVCVVVFMQLSLICLCIKISLKKPNMERHYMPF